MQYFLKLGWILFSIFLTQQAFALTIGIGWHPQGEDPQAVAQLLKNGGFRHLRFDIGSINYHNPSPQTINLVQKMQANGIDVTAIIYTAIARKVEGGYCPGDQPAIEAQGYSDAFAQADGLKDYVKVFELQNEVSLYPNVRNGGRAPFTNAALYNTACGNTMAAVLRGMSRAVRDVANSSGKPLRTIIGAASDGSTGFLKFMQQKGVAFDIVGFHIYPSANQALITTDPWYGPNGAIGLLTEFGKPIHINEFNCGETYQAGFTNTTGSTSMNTCVQSLNKQLTALLNSKANIEVIDMFELIDRRSTSVCASGNPFSGSSADAECRFGVRYDMSRAKPSWDLASSFAQRTNNVVTPPSPVTTPVSATDTPIVAIPPTPVVTPVPPVTPPKNPTVSDNSSINAARLSTLDYVWDVYRVLLGRDPSSTEATTAIADLNAGKYNRLQMQKTIVTGVEYQTRKNNNVFTLPASITQLSKQDFITLLYKLLLQRAPDAAGLSAWMQNDSAYENILRGFLGSWEYAGIYQNVVLSSVTTATLPATPTPPPVVNTTNNSVDGSNQSINDALLSNGDYVWDAFRLLLGREPSGDEVNTWVTRLEANEVSRIQVIKLVQILPEYQSQKANNAFVITASLAQLSKEDFITVLYKTLLQRTPDTAGFAAWMRNNLARERILRAFINSGEYRRLYQ